ncbi:MAG: RdgB/HAM1 family non-canonical purine NTP pyrophosphatase [Termitinemataceae bacterium]|nr:MAG: RdgB/HAM1 family non-canonical purine NTP pyrophosphatase [Termitinemataceae bacterium]
MSLTNTIWFASGNVHKKMEVQEIFKQHVIKIPLEIDVDFKPIEDGATFIDNALIKARALYGLLHEPCLADDSGLCVDALEGRPGIYSSRYGGCVSDKERNGLLLQEMAGQTNRRARFVCAFVLMLDPNRFTVVQETLEGEITESLRGSGGFGYDPIFYLPDFSCTLAELSAAEKNKLSHRGKAAASIAKLLEPSCPASLQ